MKLTTTICLIFLSFSYTVFGQKGDVNQKFIDALKAGNEKEMMQWIDKGADINVVDTMRQRVALFATNLTNIALIYDSLENYTKAERLYIKALKIRKEVLGENHPDYASSLDDLADLYKLLEQYSQAKSLYLEALQIRKTVFGESHPDYATSLNNLAGLYKSMGNFDQAEQLYLEAIKIRKKTLGENHPDYAKSLNGLAVLYYNNEKYGQAEPLFVEAIKIMKVVLGENHPDYATMLNNLAGLYKTMQNYEKAELIYIETLRIRKTVLGESHPKYLTSLNNLAGLYESLGNYSKAEPLYVEVMKTYKIKLGENHPNYTTSLVNLALLYNNMGNYAKAEPLYLEAIKIDKITLGENHPDYATSLNNLAFLYYNTGNYAKAEPLYLEALKIRKTVLGDTHPDYANSLNNLAALYYSIGNYAKAEPLYVEAIKIAKTIMGENHSNYATSLNNLALLYKTMGNYAKAEPLYLEAMKIIKIALGENHPDNATSFNNLADLYESMGNYAKAEPLYLEAIKIYKIALGENHPSYATSINNLADLYVTMGNYAKAEPLYLQAMKIYKIALGENHPSYATSLNNLAALYNSMGNYAKAEPMFLENYSVSGRNIKTGFSFLSEKERGFYWETKKNKFEDIYPSFAYKYYPEKPSISTFAYNNALFTKGLLLNTSVQIQNAILQSGDSTLIASWNTMRSLRQQIKMLESKPLAEQTGLQALENQADSIDKVLTKKSQLYKQSQTEMQQKWTDVQNSLQPNEAAIEFVSFRYYNKQYTDSMLNYALVLKKNSPYPELIPLFENKQLDSLFLQSTTNVNQLYTFRLSNLREDSLVRELNYGEKLYDLVWKPLQKSLQGINTVYYSPSGKLHQVSFAAIPVDSTILLCDKYNLYQVTSTREVIKHNATNTVKAANTPKKISHEAVLFGGIQYELDDKQLAQVQTTSNEDNNNRSIFVNDSDQRSGSFGYLKGTADEVNTIDAEFKKNGSSSQLLTGVAANEAQFKHLTGTSTEVIHVATHGFYLPVKDTRQEDFKFMGMEDNRRNVVYQNPLLRSGLIFAGANKAWKGESIPDNWEDGILTAQEITQLNLTKTQLVVLSACETGLGDDGGSEGVFGLQRSFKMAGVQTLIISLWKVPDTQTSQLMQGFYKYWLSGMTKHNAFTKAQNEVRKSNPNPYFWAAFVMVD